VRATNREFGGRPFHIPQLVMGTRFSYSSIHEVPRSSERGGVGSMRSQGRVLRASFPFLHFHFLHFYFSFFLHGTQIPISRSVLYLNQ